MPVPFVVEQHDGQERVVDIYSRLLQEFVVFMTEGVTEDSSNRVVSQLLYLNAIDPNRDIKLFVNSPGGSVTAGMAIYDIMQGISNDVATVCIGQAASMGATLLLAGTAGKRYALPNSRIMIHQPLAGMEGTATDLEIHAREVLKVKRKMNEIMLKHTGQTLDKIEEDTDRDNFMDANESKEYGIIDHVVEKITDLP